MTITTRIGKGSALTNLELDANFTHLGGDGSYQAPSTKGTAGQVLRMNSGATALEFGTVSGGGGISDLVDDTTPQLGGALDTNGNNITFSDNAEARFGAGTDLFIKSDGSNSVIQGAGTTYLRGSTVIIGANGGSGGFETGIKVREISSETSNVELYYDNSKKLETSSTGIQTTGTVNVNGAYTLPTSDGTSGQVMTTDGAGAVTFATASGGGGTTTTTAGESATTRYIPFVDSSTGTSNETVRVDPALSFINNSSSFTGDHKLTVGQGSVSLPVTIMLNGNNNGGNYTPELKFYDGDTSASTDQKMGRITFQSADTGANGLARIEANVKGGQDPNDGSRIIFSTTNDSGTYAERLRITEGGALQIGTAYTLPTSDGTSGQVMTTDGSGAVTFADAGGGGGADLYAANESSPSAQPSATGSNAIAIGDSSTSSGNQSFALGGGTASDSGAFAFGLMSTASDGYAIAFPRSTASARGSFAAGSNGLNVGSVAAGIGSMALATSYASGESSFAAAITNNTSTYGATGANSIAMGKLAKSTNTDSVAIGSGAAATGSESMALHKGSLASGLNSTALGMGAYATATNSIALGTSAYAYGAGGAALGRNARSYGEYAVGLANSYATNSNSLAGAIGTNSSSYGAKHDYGVAFGYQAVTTADKQIALGSSTAQVKVSGAYTLPTADGSANQVLTAAGDGSTSWATASGGGSSIGGATGVEFDDNVKVKFGSSGGNELEIYTDGTSSYITESGSSDLNIQGNEIKFKNASGTSLMTLSASQMEVFHSGSKKLETYPGGIQTTGTVNVNNAYTLPTSDGSANQVLTTDGSGAVTFADAGGGGADLYAENYISGTKPSASGNDAVSIGLNSSATNTNSIAIGHYASATGISGFSAASGAATGYRSVAIASSAWASATDSAAFGYQAHATGTYAVAFAKSLASGNTSFAAGIGNNSSSYGASGTNSIAMGQLSKATAANSIAIGDTAISSTANLIALGGTTDTVQISGTYTLPTSDGTNGQVLTTDGSGVSSWSTASGGGGSSPDLFVENPSSPTTPLAGGTNGVAIGSGSNAGGSGAIAIGVGSAAGDGAFCAINGGGNTAYGAVGNRSIAMGEAARAQGQDSVAIGENSLASSADSFAIGYNTDATATNASAFGYNAQAAGGNSVALGNSRASGTDSFAAAIATNSSSYGASGANSVALGYQSRATGSKAFAHNGGLASGTNSAALFDSRAEAVGDYCIALGHADARGSSSVSVNNSNSGFASGNNCFSVGQGAQAGSTSYLSYNSCIAMGYEPRAIGGSHAIALGFRARANRNNAVAIGERALSDQDGKNSYSSGAFGSTHGSAQSAKYVLRSDTGDATAEALTTNNSTAGAYNQIVLPNNSVYGFTGTVIAREDSSSTNDFAVWEIKGGAVRAGSAATTALGSYNINRISESTGATNWSIALSADTTNGAVAITVTGEASHSIRWVATVNTTEVIY